MKTSRWNIEHTLYILIFLLALALRLVRLGAYPLSNFEAGWALQALDISVGQESARQVALGPNPGYALGTSLLFPVLGDSNAAARLWPALAGACLVFLPLCFRRQLGRGAALILALGLALDPGLVAVSRTAGGGMPALVFGLFALAAIPLRKPLLAGLLAGLALLSGVDILAGALGLALTWGLAWLLDKIGVLSPAGEQEPATDDSTGPSMLRSGLYFLAGALLFIGTLFFWRPQGLEALASTLPAYLDGWGTASGIPVLRLPVSLLVYQPLAVIFGVIGALRGWLRGTGRGRTSQILSLWALAALLVAMVYPAHQVSDLIWALVPLWGLAAIELDYLLSQKIAFPGWLVSLGQAVFLCLLAAFAWLSWWKWLTTKVYLGSELYSQVLREALIMEIGALALAAITLLLVSLGWSWSVARRGLTWATCALLGTFMLAGLMGVSQVRPGSVAELWNRSPAGGEAALFQKTIQDISNWGSGIKNTSDVVVQADSPSMRWMLREWENARFASEPAMAEMPSIIVTTQGQETPSLEATYRGQDFAWEVYPAWEGILPPDLMRWLAFREAPVAYNQVILWARSDIFPGGDLIAQPETFSPSSDQIVP